MTRARLLAATLALSLGGCAMYGSGALTESSVGVMRAGTAPAQAESLVRPGSSTKAEVAAALGRANVIPFESGYEVWVYRWLAGDRSARSATELVILFDRSGIARKARVRPGYGA